MVLTDHGRQSGKPPIPQDFVPFEKFPFKKERFEARLAVETVNNAHDKGPKIRQNSFVLTDRPRNKN